MKQTIAIALCTIALFTGCEELDPTQSGNLVPKTADEDSSIPHINVNGTVLHAEAFGDPTNPMVVFLHGGPGNDYRGGLNVNELANDGYYVVFYDQRGAGLSKRHAKNSFNIQIMFDDLTAVIEHYRTSPIQKVFLFGHSWGAMVAAGYINEYPTATDGAILAEPGGLTWARVKEYGERSRKIDLLAEVANDVLFTDQLLTAKGNDQEVLDYKMALQLNYIFTPGNVEGVEGPFPFWRCGAVSIARFMEIGEEDGFDFTTNLDQYQAHVLLLYSEDNKAYGKAFAQTEADYFPNATIAQVDDTGHEMLHFQWNNVHPLVLTYLNSLN
jgi:proline iminopeptidase